MYPVSLRHTRCYPGLRRGDTECECIFTLYPPYPHPITVPP